jgi:hypothetical protein
MPTRSEQRGILIESPIKAQSAFEFSHSSQESHPVVPDLYSIFLSIIAGLNFNP